MKEVNFMKTKRMIMLLMVAVFTLGVMGLALAAQEVKGTVAKIEGDRLTIEDVTGKRTTVRIADPKILQDLKVGDRVEVGKDGKVTKEGG
jgi:hypothetical protein